ncbi:DsbC family protein [Vogesella sp. GCM10023246]|uniref:Thiol:disulfide interchange protein n=1 Tax=Vogesella oryzagri TaxID=3160864 RepID=A0ABV1M7G2_9NEIS
MMKREGSWKLLLMAAAMVVGFAGVVQADEAQVATQLEQRFPGMKAEQVRKAPMPGWYEIFSSGQLFYVDDGVNFVLQGAVIDAKTRQNLTAMQLAKLTVLPFDKLPFEQAIKIVKGDGKRKMAVFEDPHCPYCKQLEGELLSVNNVTVYVFLFPIEQLHPGATLKSRQIWCASDPAKAWLAAVNDGVAPGGTGDCANPVANLEALARKHRITGTPTMFFENNERVAGAVPAARIEALLNAAASR